MGDMSKLPNIGSTMEKRLAAVGITDVDTLMKTGGCLQIKKTFWGEQCPVKSSCESKELEHCGKCEAFPCDLLKQFAYDKEQGDNGKRIEQCKKWAGI